MCRSQDTTTTSQTTSVARHPPASKGGLKVFQGPLSLKHTAVFPPGTTAEQALVGLKKLGVAVPKGARLTQHTRPGSAKPTTAARSVSGTRTVPAGMWEVSPAVEAPVVPVLGIVVFVNAEGLKKLVRGLDVSVGKLVIVQHQMLPHVTKAIKELISQGVKMEWKKYKLNRGAAAGSTTCTLAHRTAPHPQHMRMRVHSLLCAGWNAAFMDPQCDDTLNYICWKMQAQVLRCVNRCTPIVGD